MKLIKDKTYHYDDPFKEKARAHQFAFKENVLNDFYDEKNPQVYLSPNSAKQGLIFCDVYRNLIRNKTKSKSFNDSALFSNMLRSEHIPYNIFTPMEENLDSAVSLFNKIIGGSIDEITSIEIEYPGYSKEKNEYLKDGTSFDTFVKYKACDGSYGGIGIEVKYTEKSYRIGDIEKRNI